MKKPFSIALTASLAAILVVGAACVDRKVIAFWNGFGAVVAGYLNPICNDYKNVSEDDYEINVQSYGGYDALYKAIDLGISNKAYPNMAVAYPDHMATYISKYVLVALDKYLADAGLSTDDFIDDYMPENQGFGVYEKGDFIGQPKTMGLPFNKSTELFVYNKTYFEWIATVNPSITLPQTWDEVLTQGIAIRDLMKNGNGGAGYYAHMVARNNQNNTWKAFAYDSKGELPADYDTNIYEGALDFKVASDSNFYPFGYDSVNNMFITILRQFGSVYTAIGRKSTGEVNPTTGTYEFTKAANWPKTVEAITMAARLFQKRVLGLPTQNFGGALYCSNAFKAFQTVAVVGSSGGLENNVIVNPYTKVSTAPIPYNGNSADGKHVISQGTNLVCFQKKEADVVPTIRAIKYLTSEVNLDFCMKTGYFPVKKADRVNPLYIEFLNTEHSDPKVDIKRLGANTTNYEYVSEGSTWHNFVDPGFTGSSLIREAVGNILGLLASKTDLATLNDAQLLTAIENAVKDTVETFDGYRPSTGNPVFTF